MYKYEYVLEDLQDLLFVLEKRHRKSLLSKYKFRSCIPLNERWLFRGWPEIENLKSFSGMDFSYSTYKKVRNLLEDEKNFFRFVGNGWSAEKYILTDADCNYKGADKVIEDNLKKAFVFLSNQIEVPINFSGVNKSNVKHISDNRRYFTISFEKKWDMIEFAYKLCKILIETFNLKERLDLFKDYEAKRTNIAYKIDDYFHAAIRDEFRFKDLKKRSICVDYVRTWNTPRISLFTDDFTFGYFVEVVNRIIENYNLSDESFEEGPYITFE